MITASDLLKIDKERAVEATADYLHTLCKQHGMKSENKFHAFLASL
jgi:hypothetical protein